MSADTEIDNFNINLSPAAPEDMPDGGEADTSAVPICPPGDRTNFSANLFSLSKVIGILDTFHDFAKGSRVDEKDSDFVRNIAASISAKLVCMPDELLTGLDSTGKVNSVIKYITNGQGGSVKGNYERGIEEVFEDNERYNAILGQFKTTVSVQEIIRSKLEAAAAATAAPPAADEIDDDGNKGKGALQSKRPELWKELCGEYIPDGDGRDTKIALGPALTKRSLNVFWDEKDNGAVDGGKPKIEAHTVMNVEDGQYMRILADFITKYLYPEKKGLATGAFIFDMNSGSIGKIFTALPQINASINELCVSDSAPTSLKQIGKDINRNTIKFIKTADETIDGKAVEVYQSQGNTFSWDQGVRFHFLNTDFYGGANNWCNFTLRISIHEKGEFYIKFNLLEKMGPSVAYLSSLIGALARDEPKLPDVPSGQGMVNITDAFNQMRAGGVDKELAIAILFDIKRCGDWEQSRAAQIASAPEHVSRGTPNTMFCTGDVLCSLFSRLSNGNVIWHNEEGDGAMGWKISLYRTPNVGTEVPQSVQDCINIIRKSKTLELILDRICHASELQSNFCNIADYAYQAITSRATYQINDKTPAAPGSLLGDLEILCTQICRLGAADTYFRALEFITLLSKSNELLLQITGQNIKPEEVCYNVDVYVSGLNYFRDLFNNYGVTTEEKATRFLDFARKPIFALGSADIDSIHAESTSTDVEREAEKVAILGWIEAEKTKIPPPDQSATIESIISDYVSKIGKIDPVSEVRKVLDAISEIPISVKEKIVVPEGTQAFPRVEFPGYNNKDMKILGDYLHLGQSYSELTRTTSEGKKVFKNSWTAPWGFSFSISNLRPFVNYIKQMYNDLTERLYIKDGSIIRKIANFAEFKIAALNEPSSTLVAPENILENKYLFKTFVRQNHNASYDKLTSSKRNGYPYIVENITFNNRAIYDIVHKGFIAPNLFNFESEGLDLHTNSLPFINNLREMSQTTIDPVLASLQKYSKWLASVLNNGTYLRPAELPGKASKIDEIVSKLCVGDDAAEAAVVAPFEIKLNEGQDDSTYRDLILYSEYGNNSDTNITEFKNIMYYAVKSLMIGKQDIRGFNKLPLCYVSKNDMDHAALMEMCNKQVQIASMQEPSPARGGGGRAGGNKMIGGAITVNEGQLWQTGKLDDFLFEICGKAQASIEPLIGNLSTVFAKLENILQIPSSEKPIINKYKLALEYCEIGNHDGKGSFDELYPGVSASWVLQYAPVRTLIGSGVLLPGYEKLFFKAISIYSEVSDKYHVNILGFDNTVSELQDLLQEFIFNNSNNTGDYNLSLVEPPCPGLYFLAKFLTTNMDQEFQNEYLKTSFEPIFNTGEAADVFATRLQTGFERRRGRPAGGDKRKREGAPETASASAPAPLQEQQSAWKKSRGPSPAVADDGDVMMGDAPAVVPAVVPAVADDGDVMMGDAPAVVPAVVPAVAAAASTAAPAPADAAMDLDEDGDEIDHPMGRARRPRVRRRRVRRRVPAVAPLLPSFKILFSFALFSNILAIDPKHALDSYNSSKLLQLFLATAANIKYLYKGQDIQNWYPVQTLQGNIMYILITLKLRVDESENSAVFRKADKSSIALLSGGKKRKTRKKKNRKKKTRRNKKHKQQTKRKNKRKHKKTRGRK